MAQKVNCIIVDDEPLAVDLIVDYTTKFPWLEVGLATTDVYEAIKYIQQQRVDLIFIDIQMPDVSGIQFMKMFDQNHSFIITSAYQQYALESYDFQVVDYLLKPIVFDRFCQSIEKFKKMRFNTEILNQSVEHIVVKSNGKLIKLSFEEIVYVEGLKDYVQVFLASGLKHIVYVTMKKMEESLSTHFVRVHKSYLVRKKVITVLEGNQIVVGDRKIPIGEKYKNAVISLF